MFGTYKAEQSYNSSKFTFQALGPMSHSFLLNYSPWAYISKHFKDKQPKAYISKHFIKGCTLAQIWYRKPYQHLSLPSFSSKFNLQTLYRKLLA
jgi:hypothetical protein